MRCNILLALLLAAGMTANGEAAVKRTATKARTTKTAVRTGTSKKTARTTQSAKINQQKQKSEKPTMEQNVMVDFQTTMGPIRIKLYDDTPAHRDNFTKLVKEGFYDGVLFHRVIDGFMVQTGDPNSRNAAAGEALGAGDPNYTLPAEIKYPEHYHKYGALAAARTGDYVNPERRSSGSQFYIVTGQKYTPEQLGMMQQRRPGMPIPENVMTDYTTIGGTPHLDGQYTVFGEVVSGMDTVEKIQKAETDRRDRPVEDIRIISAKIAEK